MSALARTMCVRTHSVHTNFSPSDLIIDIVSRLDILKKTYKNNLWNLIIKSNNNVVQFFLMRIHLQKKPNVTYLFLSDPVVNDGLFVSFLKSDKGCAQWQWNFYVCLFVL